MLQVPSIQTKAANFVTEQISNSLDGEIKIDKVFIVLFNKIILRDVSIVSKEKSSELEEFYRTNNLSDTLISCKKISLGIDSKELFKLRLKLKSIQLSNGVFNLQSEEEKRSNLDRIFKIDKDRQKDTTKEGGLNLLANSLKIDNFRFTLKNPYRENFRGDSIINFADLDVRNIYLNINNVKIENDTLYARVSTIKGRDKSGFWLEDINGEIRICSTEAIIENLSIRDRYSNIRAKYFYMRYSSPKDLASYVEKVRMGIEFDNAYLDFKTIGRIAPALYNSSLGLYASGFAGGPVNNLKSKDLTISTKTGQSTIYINSNIIGLPDVSQAMTFIDIHNLVTTSNDISWIISSLNNTPRLSFFNNLKPFIQYRFKGGLSGLLTDFVAHGLLTSRAGDLKVDILFKSGKEYNGVIFKGGVASKELNFDKILHNSPIGELTMNSSLEAHIKPNKSGLNIKIDSIKIDKLGFNGYNYSNIYALGQYTQSFFDGRIICRDPNLDFLFQGLLSFDKEGDNEYNFYANIPYADLSKLNFDKRDTISKLSLITAANFKQNADKNLFGKIVVNDLNYSNSKGEYHIGSMNMLSKEGGGDYNTEINAPFAKVVYNGKSPALSFINSILNFGYRDALLNLKQEEKRSVLNDGEHNLTVKTNNTMGICELLVPGLYIQENSNLNIQIDNNNGLDLNLKSDRIAYKQNYIKDLQLNIKGKDSTSKVNLLSTRINAIGMVMDSSTINLTAQNNSIDFGFDFKNDSTENNKATILGNLEINPNNYRVNIKPLSEIKVKGEQWVIEPSIIELNSNNIAIDSFKIKNKNQLFLANGNIGGENDTLSLSLKEFNVEIFNLFLNKKFYLEGYFSGESTISSFKKEPRVFLNLTGDSVKVYKNDVGIMRVLSKWDNENKRFNVLLNTRLNNKPTMSITGFYRPENTYFNLNASLEELSVSYFEPFLADLISKTSGSLSGDLSLEGPLNRLKLSGENCNFKDFIFTLNFSKVPYILNGPVHIDENGVIVKDLPIRDNYGGTGRVNGGLKYHYFRDIYVDTRIDFNKLKGLSTKEKDNSQFYGEASATGSVNINGPLNKINIDLSGLTENKTEIHIPLSQKYEAHQSNLLTFKDRELDNFYIDPYDTIAAYKRVKEEGSELDVKIDANITPISEIMIEINKSVGDVIKAKGNGLIQMRINPNKEVFDIYGNFDITEGSYKFVLGGFAAKDFKLEPGGQIMFNGDITKTTLNLKAIYKTKASINPLIADTSSISTRRSVNCEIMMDGNLMNPNLKFNIDIPDLDPTTKIRVESALNTEGKIQKQFMAIVVSGGFIPDEQSGIANNSSILYSNASEILSNQVNMIFEQLGIPLDLGLNYQPGSNGTNIFDVAVSTQLFNNRVLINGNIGNDPYENSGNDVIGNIDVEIKMDNNGKIRLNLFSHSEDRYSSYTNDRGQRSGVGIVYQKEFNSFKDFLKRKSKAQKLYEKQQRNKKRAKKKL